MSVCLSVRASARPSLSAYMYISDCPSQYNTITQTMGLCHILIYYAKTSMLLRHRQTHLIKKKPDWDSQGYTSFL